MFGLPYHPKREKPAYPHSMVMKVDVHSAHTASLKLICYLAGDNEIYHRYKNTKFYVRCASVSEKRETSSFSQHGDAIGCSLSPYCKYEINQRSFDIWLVAIQ